MSDAYQAIGETAGKIFKALEKNGSLNPSSLQREIQVSDSALFQQAVGWLAREGKLNFEKKGKTEKLSLSGAQTYC